MDFTPSPRIIGACIVGLALVAGTYVLTNFGNTDTSLVPITETDEVVVVAAPVRVALPETDADNNGIQDWRDELITTDPIIISDELLDEVYEPPTTITGQLGINFVQDVIRTRAEARPGGDEALIESTVAELEAQTSVAIYDTPDITFYTDWEAEDIRAYANAVALAIIENSETDLDLEILILQDILNRRDESRLAELETLAEIYRLTRDAVIAIPVPSVLVKEHLDLINTLHAVHTDVTGMTLVFNDPAVSLLRLKRYEDDVLGMTQALNNIYTALEPYASLFNTEDPAVFFIQFSNLDPVRI